MAGHYLPGTFPVFKRDAIWSFGGAGVLLFFYLSGFLIYRNIQKQSLGVFLSRRFFKLLPAYWVNIAVIVLLALVFGSAPLIDAKTVASNLFLVQEFAGSELLNGVYWTLQIEVKFYILMAAFCYYIGPRHIYWLLAALLLLDLALLFLMGRGSTLITYLIAFFPGITAARITARGWDKSGFMEMGVVTSLVAVALFLCLGYLREFQAIYAIIFSALLVLALVYNFRSSLFAFFGKISYSDYLYHTLIGYMVISWLAGDTVSSRLLSLLLAFGASTAVAAISYYCIEKPAVAFGLAHEKRLPLLGVLVRSAKGVAITRP